VTMPIDIAHQARSCYAAHEDEGSLPGGLDSMTLASRHWKSPHGVLAEPQPLLDLVTSAA
jgi:hypothetical protein